MASGMEAEALMSDDIEIPELQTQAFTNPPSRPQIQRQSSLSKIRPNGEPRTPNRVRFDDTHTSVQKTSPQAPSSEPQSQREQGTAWLDLDDHDELEEEDYLATTSPRDSVPLLTNITPPSVSPFTHPSFTDAQDHLPGSRPTSSLLSAFTNMANSILGAGIIGQPYALRQSGLLTGILLLILLTITVDWTIRLIIVNSKLSGTDSFQATVQHCFGKPGLIAISVAQWVFAFGGMVAFCVIIGDTVPSVVRATVPGIAGMKGWWVLGDRRFLISATVLGVSWPLSLYRDISKLAGASGFALASMGIIVFTVVSQGWGVEAESRGGMDGLWIVSDGVFQAVGVISFAFVCHHNSLLIYSSLRTPTLDRFSKVTHYSTFVSFVACLTMALAGFLTFGSATKGNVLNNFPTEGNIMVQIARLCFGLNMLTTLPLECFVCREVMNNYWFAEEPYQPNRHLIFSSALVWSAVAISLFTCDLGVVFELVGATSACALAYILPPLCYVKLSKRSWKHVPAYTCIAFGSSVMVVSIIQALGKIITGGNETHQC